MVVNSSPDNPTKDVLHILQKHRVVLILGGTGIGKSTFALSVGESLNEATGAPLMGVAGDQYRQHASFHPFEHTTYLESLRKYAGAVVRVGATVAGTIEPSAKVAYPVYQALRGIFRAQRGAATGFTQEEVEGARKFAARSKTDRIFIFDNVHYWDTKSLSFAEKVLKARKALGLYILFVITEHDAVESANDFTPLLNAIAAPARYQYKGLPNDVLRREFLADLSTADAQTVLRCAGANIPLIKALASLARRRTGNPNLETILTEAAVEMKIDSLMDVTRIDVEQRALGCLATMGSGTSVRDIACALDLPIDETSRVLEWGRHHDLINILDAHQVVFLHDLYQRLFDTPDIVDAAFLQKINLCCSIGIPDEYEKRAHIASRGDDRDYVLSLVLSSLRQRILSTHETKFDVANELRRIRKVIGGKYPTELGRLSAMFQDVLTASADGRFEDAAWTVSISGICAHSAAFVEEAVIFAHYAYLSRSNQLRKATIRKLSNLRNLGELETERSFIVSSMLAYGLALDNQLAKATAILAEEEGRLAVSSDRFKDASYYVAICERMSLTCYENSLARRRLERAYHTFERLYNEHNYLKRPDEILKCASNLCSAYVIGGAADRAGKILSSVKNIAEETDYSWSTAPAFLLNNAMVVAIHCNNTDYVGFAHAWTELADNNPHSRILFLANAVGCFIAGESARLGELDLTTVLRRVVHELEIAPDSEAFMSYIAHFSAWQADYLLNVVTDAADHYAISQVLVEYIPYVNGDYFRLRDEALRVATKDGQRISLNEWETAAFANIPTASLPTFYRRAVHFNPIEHWLPS